MITFFLSTFGRTCAIDTPEITAKIKASPHKVIYVLPYDTQALKHSVKQAIAQQGLPYEEGLITHSRDSGEWAKAPYLYLNTGGWLSAGQNPEHPEFAAQLDKLLQSQDPVQLVFVFNQWGTPVTSRPHLLPTTSALVRLPKAIWHWWRMRKYDYVFFHETMTQYDLVTESLGAEFKHAGLGQERLQELFTKVLQVPVTQLEQADYQDVLKNMVAYCRKLYQTVLERRYSAAKVRTRKEIIADVLKSDQVQKAIRAFSRRQSGDLRRKGTEKATHSADPTQAQQPTQNSTTAASGTRETKAEQAAALHAASASALEVKSEASPTSKADLQAVSTELKQQTQQAQKMLAEIASDQQYRVLRLFDWVLGKFWNRFYSGFRVYGDTRLNNLLFNQDDASFIYVSTHRSHIDYLLLSYLLHSRVAIKAPNIAAGVNLDFWPIGYFLRRGGAFFLRRSFSNYLYSVVFRNYVAEMVRDRRDLEFYIEGGRSRTGRLLTPKTGMLNMTIGAFLNAPSANVFYVPIFLAYEKVFESATYANELRGKKKAQESAWVLAKNVRKLKYQGNVHVQFAQPLNIGDFFNRYYPDWIEHVREQKIDQGQVKLVSHKLMYALMIGINSSASVSNMGLFTALIYQDCLTYSREQALDLIGFLQSVLTKTTKFHPNYIISQDEPAKVLQTAFDVAKKHFKSTTQVSLEGQTVPGFSVNPASKAELNYYRNNIEHCLIAPALAAISLQQGIAVGQLSAQAAKDVSAQAAQDVSAQAAKDVSAQVGAEQEQFDLHVQAEASPTTAQAADTPKVQAKVLPTAAPTVASFCELFVDVFNHNSFTSYSAKELFNQVCYFRAELAQATPAQLELLAKQLDFFFAQVSAFMLQAAAALEKAAPNAQEDAPKAEAKAELTKVKADPEAKVDSAQAADSEVVGEQEYLADSCNQASGTQKACLALTSVVPDVIAFQKSLNNGYPDFADKVSVNQFRLALVEGGIAVAEQADVEKVLAQVKPWLQTQAYVDALAKQ